MELLIRNYLFYYNYMFSFPVFKFKSELYLSILSLNYYQYVATYLLYAIDFKFHPDKEK